MLTNVAIDDRLLQQARRLGKHRTHRQTVHAALAEYVARRKQREIVSLFGTIDYDPAYDHKRERQAKT